MNRKLFQSIMLLIVFTVMLVAVIVKIDAILVIVANLLRVFLPLFIGIAVAFILKRPMAFFYRLYAKKSKGKKTEQVAKLFAILSAYIVFFAVITGIFAYIIPQLVESVALFTSNLDSYASTVIDWVNRTIEYLKLGELDMSLIEDNIQNIMQGAGNLLTYLFPQIYDFTSNLLSSLFNIVIGLIVSVYMLADKDRVQRQIKKLMKAYLPEKLNAKILHIAQIVSDTFTKFITGQATEAVILGLLCYIGLLILRIEYSFLISIMIAITAFIPVVGAFLGIIPSAFILLMINPTHAWIFVIFIIVLQQIEGNFIYPRVVGDSIGLPPLWVLASVIVGGGFGGILGLFFAVPTASVIYQILGKHADKRVKTEQIFEEETA